MVETDMFENDEFILGNKPKDINIEVSNGPPSYMKTTEALDLNQDLKYGLAGKIWHSAYMLQVFFSNNGIFDPVNPIPNKYYYNNKNSDTDQKNNKIYKILELGAGTGYVGITLAKMLNSSCQIYITDLEPVVPLIQENVDLHYSKDDAINRASVFCERLHWGNQRDAELLLEKIGGGSFDLVVISDCVYFPELFQPLMNTLLQICQDDTTKVVIGYKCRSLEKETGFWDYHFGRYFDYEPVRLMGYEPKADDNNDVNDDDATEYGGLLGEEEQIFVFAGTRKKNGEVKEADDQFTLLTFGNMCL
ncbi:putative methyltransferase-domain-containing protein [Cunninghamella echinulata]|nr:putative methyltransferase-domain-containing protein [Cunninghamella echinulata]